MYIMKQPIKIYLDTENKRRLIAKASEVGFKGRGAITKYFEKIATEPIVFLDKNVLTIIEALHLNTK